MDAGVVAGVVAGLVSESPAGVVVVPVAGVVAGGVDAAAGVVLVVVAVSAGDNNCRGATWPLSALFSINWYLGTSAKKRKPEARTRMKRHRPGVNLLSIVWMKPGSLSGPWLR